MENRMNNEISEMSGIGNGMRVERRDASKDKVFLFVIGVLVGAVISTGAFFAYIKLAGVGSGQSSQMQGGGTPPEMPGGSENGQGGTPPEMPSGSSENSQGGTPPEIPSGNGSGSSQNGTSSGTQNNNAKSNAS